MRCIIVILCITLLLLSGCQNVCDEALIDDNGASNAENNDIPKNEEIEIE